MILFYGIHKDEIIYNPNNYFILMDLNLQH